jgi:hypothetical protein
MAGPWRVMKMRQFRFRALVTLDPVQPRPEALHPHAQEYPSHTRALMILALPLRADGGPARHLPAEIWQDGDEPLRAGDHATVTARVSDDHADAFLDAGARFTLWSGGEVGHGTIYRRVFTDYGPS